MRVVTLGGRRFGVCDLEARTVRQDHYLMSLIRSSGVDRALPDQLLDERTPPEAVSPQWAIQLQAALVDSGQAPEMIAGALFELADGQTGHWQRDRCEAVADFIGGCQASADREIVLQLAMEIVVHFFVQGLKSLERSLSSLRSLEAPESLSPQNAAA